MSIWTLLTWFTEYWPLIIWGAGIILAYIYGGYRLAFIVLTLGIGSVAYKAGKKNERENYEQKVNEIEKARQNAYRQIDERDTTRADIVKRLRDRSY